MITYEVKVYADGTKKWYLNDKLHRQDGPAIEWANGGKKWYLNNEFHREDGPAVEWANGDKEWYFKGKRHRQDGPAVEGTTGYKEWWLNGERLTEKEWRAKVQPSQPNCEGRLIEIDGKTYKLIEVHGE